ncbi:hypothetical protein GCM10027021_26250 [Dyella kyungheensis]
MDVALVRVATGGALLCSLCCHAVAAGAPESFPVNRESNNAAPQNGASHVQQVVAAIEQETSQKRRIDEAESLYMWVAGPAPRQVADADIDAMAGLMRDPNDSIRLAIAGALGQLGPRAKRAMPALVQALRERPCENAPATSAAVIRMAIQRIGQVVPDVPCTDPFGS